MANFTVKAGKHGSWPPHVWPWVGEQSMSRYVTFDDSCRYNSPAYNGQDVNKLFGLSFGLGGIAANDPQDLRNGHLVYHSPVHWNSARFGWRWSHSDQCIELLAYCYVNGKRNWDEELRFPVVAQIKLGQRVWCNINYTHDPEYGQAVYEFEVDADDQRWLHRSVNTVDDLPHYGLTCGLYYGGALPCPHDMHVTISRT